jgi:pimeloyl-ACP methyl ester carboxylesterase
MGCSGRTLRLGSAVAAILLVGGGGAAALRVHHSLVPRGAPDLGLDLEAMQVEIEPVRFAAVDGIELAGWLLPGQPGRTPIVLCHDFGGGRDSMLDLGLALEREGFAVLAFDFRGHGASPGQSTRGLDEKRDVLGAVDFLAASSRFSGRRVGIYGVGMGAHAAVLAAAERRQIRVLVLDGLYPDVGFPLRREVYAGWEPSFGLRGLPDAFFFLLRGRRTSAERAADVLGGLVGRDVLLLAPNADGPLAAAIEVMYRSIPEQRDSDGNLIHLPMTQSDGLYGDHVSLHRDAVGEFFASRLR